MRCPEHPDTELRVEWAPSRSGFCLKCLKHHLLCMETRFMWCCEKLRDHEGDHEDLKGNRWKDKA